MTFTNSFHHNTLKAVARLSSLMTFLIVFSFITACNDDDDDKGFPSVAGKWLGTKTEFEAKIDGVPTPIQETDDSFAGQVEFLSNGTAVYSEDGDVKTGTWSQNGDKLTLTIADDSEELDMSGIYTIKEINASKLKIYIEKAGSFEDPDTGDTFDAQIKATLYFNKH